MIDETQTARCAIHPDVPANSICARCGNFMCSTCTEGGKYDTCPKCRAITGAGAFPFSRDNYSLDGLLSYAWDHFKREWVMLSVAILVLGVIGFGVGLISSILQAIGNAIDPIAGVLFSIPGQILSTIFSLLLGGGLALIIWDVFRGGTVDISRLFSQFSRFGTYTVAVLMQLAVALAVAVPVGIAFGLGSLHSTETGIIVAVIVGLVMLIPAFYVWAPFAFLSFEIAVAGEGRATVALKNCFALADGHRLMILLVFLVWVVILIAGMLLCCIGYLPAFALAQMLLFGLYLALRNGSGLPPMKAGTL